MPFSLNVLSLKKSSVILRRCIKSCISFWIFLFVLMVSGFDLVFAQNYISGCTAITSSGVYYLTADIINSTASTCIDIQANNVVLDCQGRMIDGLDASGSYGIRIYRSSSQDTNVTIRNCVIRDWSRGIYVYRSSRNLI
ncbi:MAG: NosD domain-containing protein, partial [Candidatus Woesearchaeota archaeon]